MSKREKQNASQSAEKQEGGQKPEKIVTRYDRRMQRRKEQKQKELRDKRMGQIIGAVLAVRWLLELKREKHACKGCHDCGKLEGKAGVLPMLCAGLTYGFIPCAPLLLMIGYSFTLSVPLAGATGVAFSLASMASPVLLLTVITGALSRKMRQEIPGCIKWFRLGSYLLLMVMPFIITA